MRKQNRQIIVLLGVVFLGLFLRLYHHQEFFFYSHDQDLIGWIIRDIVFNKHFRLIGQQTSVMGIFIGPFFYYYLVPFYMAFKMDPISGVYGVFLLSIFGILSFYYIFTKLHGFKAGIFASLIYSISYFILLNDREVVPTMPVIIWSAWFYYVLNLLLKGQKKGFLISGVLIGLIWHLNMALALTLPLIPLSVYLSRKRIEYKSLWLGMVIALLISLPLFIFEFRHSFVQSKALIDAFTKNQGGVITGFYKYEKVFISQGNTIKTMVFGPLLSVNYRIIFTLGILVFIYLRIKKVLDLNLSLILIAWLFIYYLFFSLYSLVLSEYYLNGSLIIWISLFILFVSKILGKDKKWFLLISLGFVALHLVGYFSSSFDRKGYNEKVRLVRFVNEDRIKREYPCLAISYITDPGYELGWRYLFWRENVKVLRPNSGAPVYSIVFPLSRVDRVDKYFGALGLIWPDYNKYTKQSVATSCQGENSNLTDSMFGFTK